MVLVAVKEVFLNMWVITLQQAECPVYFGNGQTPWLVVRKRTIPTERPPLVGEISAKFWG
jgi:hypothetical protein